MDQELLTEICYLLKSPALATSERDRRDVFQDPTK
jgi:hypothetical protein